MGTTCVNGVVQPVEQGTHKPCVTGSQHPRACKVELRMNCGKLHAKEDHSVLVFQNSGLSSFLPAEPSRSSDRLSVA